MPTPAEQEPNRLTEAGERLLALVKRHPETAVLVSTSVGLATGVLLSKFIESEATIERGRTSRIAHQLGRQLMDATHSLTDDPSGSTLASLRNLIKG